MVGSQSVKGADTVSCNSHGYDPAKRINDRKRHIAVDLRDLPLSVMVTPADVSDRAAGREVRARLREQHPQFTLVWADSAYAGTLVTWAKWALNLTVKTVHRPRGTVGFAVGPTMLDKGAGLTLAARCVTVAGS
ncbi:transposase [Streptomyces sp. NPDC018059]|uniref:transposase n=1 Tax=Streptomyces sp. NPDC018059 TaxID=3365041 RepID=UPI00378C8FC2